MNPLMNYNTPIDRYPAHGLWVKREDLCVGRPFPAFSKCRGVIAHLQNRPEKNIGVLDTYHSQAGQAVAAACAELGKTCFNFYPVRKAEEGAPLKPQQQAAVDLGAQMVRMRAGRSAILYHQARRHMSEINDSYMMPNALKLPETVKETAEEVWRMAEFLSKHPNLPILIAVSSATIGAGVLEGLHQIQRMNPVIFHMGYSRSHEQLLKYVHGLTEAKNQITLVDEGYSYGDRSTLNLLPEWPCNIYYDLKAFHWWKLEGQQKYGEALMWNIG